MYDHKDIFDAIQTLLNHGPMTKGKEKAVMFLSNVPVKLDPNDIRDLENITDALNYVLDHELMYGKSPSTSLAVDLLDEIMWSYYDDQKKPLGQKLRFEVMT